MLLTGSVWSAGQPSAATVAAYQADPAPAVLRTEVESTLRQLLATVLAGLLAR